MQQSTGLGSCRAGWLKQGCCGVVRTMHALMRRYGVCGRFGAGVPCKQYQLIHRDGLRISTYVARTFDGIARTSHLRKDNYFYYNCLTGRFARDNCPSYLVKDNFAALKGGLVNNLEIITGTFMEALQSRTYTKARLPSLPGLCLCLRLHDAPTLWQLLLAWLSVVACCCYCRQGPELLYQGSAANKLGGCPGRVSCPSM